MALRLSSRFGADLMILVCAYLLAGIDRYPVIAIILIASSLVILGIWERIVRARAVNWPMAPGVVNSASITELRSYWLLKLNYSFSVYGRSYTGRYSRRFSYEDEALKWARALEGDSIFVHYSQRWPALNLVFASDIENLLKRLPPEPHTSASDQTISVPVPVWKKLVAYPLMALALIGFGISFYAHIATWLGKLILTQSQSGWMHIGMFIVFFPAIFLQPRARKRSRLSADELPEWIGNLMLIIFFYAIANFCWFMLQTFLQHGKADHLHELRGFSGYWLMFYFWSFGLLFQATHPKLSRLPVIQK
jgi:hypothetical protein